MTTYATETAPLAAPTRDRTGPILTTVTGGVVALFALILVLGGAALFWASDVKTDADGYYTTATHEYASPTRALVTENLDIDADLPGWLTESERLGSLRVDPRAAASDKPVFVGVAPTRDVHAYLDQVQHETVTDVDFEPFRLDTVRSAGEGRPALPAAQPFWAATSTDGRPLEWDVRSGDWSIVMMNADGSAGIDVDASVGAKAPFIRDLGWILLIPGLGLAVIALVLVTVGVRGLARRD